MVNYLIEMMDFCEVYRDWNVRNRGDYTGCL